MSREEEIIVEQENCDHDQVNIFIDPAYPDSSVTFCMKCNLCTHELKRKDLFRLKYIIQSFRDAESN